MSRTLLPPRDPYRNPAIACGCLLAIIVALVAFGRGERPPPPALDAAVRSLALRFEDLPDGTVVALNAATGAAIERLAPGEGGFVRVTMRSFAGERKRRGITGAEPFTLARMTDGDLVLQDPATGRTMLLNAFGPSNEGVFAALLEPNGRSTR